MHKIFVCIFFLVACSPGPAAVSPKETDSSMLSPNLSQLVLPESQDQASSVDSVKVPGSASGMAELPSENPTEDMNSAVDSAHESATTGTETPSASVSETQSSERFLPLIIEKNVLHPLEEFEVHFSMSPKYNLDETAWVGIIPAEIPHGNENDNDFFDLAYATLGGNQEGTLVFEAPDQGGDYELRLFSSDNQGEELYSIPFSVDAPIPPISGNQIRTNKMIFRPGETIQAEVSIKAEDKLDETAWVGIVPTEVPHGSEEVNDSFNLGFRYMGPYLAGKIELKAPAEAGVYDLRLHNSDNKGQELVFVTFLVKP